MTKSAQRLQENVESYAGTVGLAINVNKTKVVTINIKDDCKIIKTARGEVLDKVDEFRYLRSRIHRIGEEVHHHIA